MAKKPTFRIGDRVRVMQAKEFLRCGYPLCLPEVIEDIRTNRLNELNAAARAFGLDPAQIKTRGWNRIIEGFAYATIQAKRFGGPKREIHERDLDPSIVGQTYSIIYKYGVMTGEYYPPSGYAGSMWDKGDYEPGGLANQAYHMILVLNAYGIHKHVYPETVAKEALGLNMNFKSDQIVKAAKRKRGNWEGYFHICAEHVERVTDPE